MPSNQPSHRDVKFESVTDGSSGVLTTCFKIGVIAFALTALGVVHYWDRLIWPLMYPLFMALCFSGGVFNAILAAPLELEKAPKALSHQYLKRISILGPLASLAVVLAFCSWQWMILLYIERAGVKFTSVKGDSIPDKISDIVQGVGGATIDAAVGMRSLERVMFVLPLVLLVVVLILHRVFILQGLKRIRQSHSGGS